MSPKELALVEENGLDEAAGGVPSFTEAEDQQIEQSLSLGNIKDCLLRVTRLLLFIRHLGLSNRPTSKES